MTDTMLQAPSDGTDDDPHAPKISADDPRLKVSRPTSRVLKMKPVVACIGGILCIGGYVVLASVRTRDASVSVEPEPTKVTVTAPPAFIQKAPANPAPPEAPQPIVSPPPTSSVELPARATFSPPPRPDPIAQQALQQQLARDAELARAELEAQNSGLFFSSGTQRTAQPSTTGALAAVPAAQATLLPTVTPSSGQATDGGDPNLQLRKNAFLDQSPQRQDYLHNTLQRAVSPYEVKATTIIPATLITGINSDLPGPIIAQVRERVYDTVTGDHLLIPQGARLLASYDSMVAWGQERVLMCWNRIIFPNGNSINIDCMPAADLQGQAGLTDEVDNHWGRLLGAVGLSTVLSLGAQAAAGDPSGYQPNLAQRAASNAAGQINAAGQAVVQRQINIQPTITVRPGFGVNVVVTKDMVLQPYTD